MMTLARRFDPIVPVVRSAATAVKEYGMHFVRQPSYGEQIGGGLCIALGAALEAALGGGGY